jgi:hypothetical protein
MLNLVQHTSSLVYKTAAPRSLLTMYMLPFFFDRSIASCGRDLTNFLLRAAGSFLVASCAASDARRLCPVRRHHAPRVRARRASTRRVVVHALAAWAGLWPTFFLRLLLWPTASTTRGAGVRGGRRHPRGQGSVSTGSNPTISRTRTGLN